MIPNFKTAALPRLPVLATAAAALFFIQPIFAANLHTIQVHAAGFQPGNCISATDSSNQFELRLDGPDVTPLPVVQSALKQGTAQALLGPNPALPYFTVRFAMPVPPENTTNSFAALTGLGPQVFTHNHSPGFEILPNGDALAVYFSTPPGKAENDVATSFIQTRLRYGAEDWDLPELFLKFEGYNDQSGLLWKDKNKIWFFGGGRDLSDQVPFKLATSTDNGATWTLSLPRLDRPAQQFTAQPITSAFRGPDESIYFAMDGEKATSFLWHSADEGVHWNQMDGRTGGRHSVIVPLDQNGNLLSIGGKNSAIEGWTPQNMSSNWGASWSSSTASPFPPLGSAQRPSMIRLSDGNLFFVSDAYLHKAEKAPPAGWKNGNGCFVAISTNNGNTWLIKTLPVQLPNHERGTNGTLGYVTARQSPNGVIHVLTTESQPCLHYEMNEAWIFSEAGDVMPETSGGKIQKYSENYPSGKLRSRWSARICPNGRYLLDGRETDFYDSGAKQHEVVYSSGRKTGVETFWSPEGKKLWTFTHDLKTDHSVWRQFRPDGSLRHLSTWNTKPQARDLKRSFFGMVADGPCYECAADGSAERMAVFHDGVYSGEVRLKKGDTP